MSEEERRLYDAQADHEAWGLAHEILEPWVRTTEEIGSDELTQVMKKALAEVEKEVGRTLDVLSPFRRSISGKEGEHDGDENRAGHVHHGPLLKQAVRTPGDGART